jgi:hypothetical protein
VAKLSIAPNGQTHFLFCEICGYRFLKIVFFKIDVFGGKTVNRA